MKHDLFTAYASYYCNTESNPNMRVPDVIECVARIFGYKRGQPFFGSDGDKIAARYQSRCGWNWADDIEQAPDPTPWWVAQGRRNENMAYILVLFMALFAGGGLLALWTTYAEAKYQEQSAARWQQAQEPYAQFSPTPQVQPYGGYSSPDQQSIAQTRVHTYTPR